MGFIDKIIGRKTADSLTNTYSALANDRAAVNHYQASLLPRLSYDQMNAFYKTGLGAKCVDIKIGYAFKNAWKFASKGDEDFWNTQQTPSPGSSVRFPSPRALSIEAAKWMLTFGRGILVLQEPGVPLTTPIRGTLDPKRTWIRCFDGSRVTAYTTSVNMDDEMFYTPQMYNVWGQNIHHSRVIDFTHIKPRLQERPYYQYGGISMFELTFTQLINDGIVERAVTTILEKNATLFYKVKGFKKAMEAKQADQVNAMIEYFRQLENGRSIYGAGLLDAEDAAEILTQTLPNIDNADQVTLRRIALTWSIPLAFLVGENVKGLNSTGDNEREVFQDSEEVLEANHLLEPLNALFRKFGKGEITINENQWENPNRRLDYEKKAVEIAAQLTAMGGDGAKYLEEKGVTQSDPATELIEGLFPEANDDDTDGAGEGEELADDPKADPKANKSAPDPVAAILGDPK